MGRPGLRRRGDGALARRGRSCRPRRREARRRAQYQTDAVIERAFNLGLASLPGVATPTEAVRALGLGASALKLFPAEAMPPEIVKAWRSVLPKDTQLFPVGGVTPERIAPYRRAGADGFGIGSRSTGPAPRPRRSRARRRLSSRLGARPDKVPSAPVALGRYRSGRPGSERKRKWKSTFRRTCPAFR